MGHITNYAIHYITITLEAKNFGAQTALEVMADSRPGNFSVEGKTCDALREWLAFLLVVRRLN